MMTFEEAATEVMRERQESIEEAGARQHGFSADIHSSFMHEIIYHTSNQAFIDMRRNNMREDCALANLFASALSLGVSIGVKMERQELEVTPRA